MSEKTQLPPTATPLAKALDALENRLLDLPYEAITKHPQKVPLQLLDHLAWELSVDVWDPVWPQDIKRQVLMDAEEMHRFKGTPYGIALALKALGAQAQIEEWWQGGFDGVPGTYRVTAFADRRLYGNADFIIDNDTVFVLRSMVLAFAPVSRGLVFRMGSRGKARKAIGSALALRMRQRHAFKPSVHASGTTRKGLVTALAVRGRTRRKLKPAMIASTTMQKGIACAFRVIQRQKIAIRMEPA